MVGKQSAKRPFLLSTMLSSFACSILTIGQWLDSVVRMLLCSPPLEEEVRSLLLSSTNGGGGRTVVPVLR